MLAALGWAATKRLPILFVVEDNNLAILTQKHVRRSWTITAAAEGLGLSAEDTTDHPGNLFKRLQWAWERLPALLNVETHRKFWHAGAGVDDPDIFDRHHEVSDHLDGGYVMDVRFAALQRVGEAWARHCGT